MKNLHELTGQQLFFKPNTEFVKWLIKYAGNRIIIDAGCGEKFVLLQQLARAGAKRLVGVDPFVDTNEYMKWRTSTIDRNISFHIMPKKIQDMSVLYNGTGSQQVLLVFARPCHSDFVEETLDLKGPEIEVLYITVPENLEKYNDLGKWDSKKKLVEHEGSSADNEVVYSII